MHDVQRPVVREEQSIKRVVKAAIHIDCRRLADLFFFATNC